MPGRGYNALGYRYGFNGKEKDSEWNSGNNYDYGFRIYDSRLGRFLSEDPLSPDYPGKTPYDYAENDVIRCIDLDGLEKLSFSGTVPPSQYYIKSREGQPGNTAYEPTHIYGFKAQGLRLSKLYGVNAHQVSSGQEIINKMIAETSSHGNITFVSFFGHGNNAGGWLLKYGEGFYKSSSSGSAGSSNLQKLQDAMDKGDIKFATNAICVIDACNNAGLYSDSKLTPEQSFAYKLCETTGMTIIAADGHVGMKDETKYNGEFKITDGGTFYEFTRTTIATSVPRLDTSGNPVLDANNNPVMDNKVTYKIDYIDIGNEIVIDDYLKP